MSEKTRGRLLPALFVACLLGMLLLALDHKVLHEPVVEFIGAGLLGGGFLGMLIAFADALSDL